MLGLSLAQGCVATLIKVGWSPLALGNKLLAWWDAAYGLSLSGSQITAWADRKNGYSAVQAIGAASPISARVAGGPWVVYDGIDDELTLASQPFGGDVEVRGVLKQDALAADTSTRIALGFGGGTVGTSHRIVRIVSGAVNRAQFSVGNGASGAFVAENTVDFSRRHLVKTRVFGGNGRLSVDGGTEATVAATAAIGSTRLRFGAADISSAAAFWKGAHRHFVITTPNLTTEEAAKLDAYLLAERAL